MTRARLPLLLLGLLLVPAVLRADWIKDYEDGVKAAQSGDWAAVVQKMTSAIEARPRENARERTYGNIFIAYHPYYYRGVAHFNLGRYDEAIRDLKRATGQGPAKLGTPESYLGRAETQLAQQNQPAQPPTQTVPTQTAPTQTVPTQTVPPPTQPGRPAGDPNLGPARNRARQALAEAQERQNEARRARADVQPEFSQAMQLLVDAQTRAIDADTTSDWNAVEDRANRAAITFSLATTKQQQLVVAQKKEATPVTTAATNDALTQMRTQVRTAVEAYFSGDFGSSARLFRELTSRDRDNALLWAFLGASHFYNWYLGGESNESDKQAAIEAFRQARRSNRRLRLNERYFPQRVRNFFETVRLE